MAGATFACPQPGASVPADFIVSGNCAITVQDLTYLKGYKDVAAVAANVQVQCIVSYTAEIIVGGFVFYMQVTSLPYVGTICNDQVRWWCGIDITGWLPADGDTVSITVSLFTLDIPPQQIGDSDTLSVTYDSTAGPTNCPQCP